MSWPSTLTDGENQLRKQLRRWVRQGRARELCERVARRAAGREQLKHLRTVAIATSKHSLQDYIDGDLRPVASRLHALCRIPR